MSESSFNNMVELLRKRTHDLSNDIQREHEERVAFQIDLTGKSGDNGKFGALRGQLGVIRVVIASVAAAALGGLGTGITAIYKKGDENGFARARIEALEKQVSENAASLKTIAIWSEVIRLRLQLNGGNEP